MKCSKTQLLRESYVVAVKSYCCGSASDTGADPKKGGGGALFTRAEYLISTLTVGDVNAGCLFLSEAMSWQSLNKCKGITLLSSFIYLYAWII